jgi:hypothetical protein
MDWEPRWSDINWTRDLLSKINDGGVWVQPASCASFTFYHSKKEYVVDESHCINQDMVDRTRKVLSVLDWKERK